MATQIKTSPESFLASMEVIKILYGHIIRTCNDAIEERCKKGYFDCTIIVPWENENGDTYNKTYGVDDYYIIDESNAREKGWLIGLLFVKLLYNVKYRVDTEEEYFEFTFDWSYNSEPGIEDITYNDIDNNNVIIGDVSNEDDSNNDDNQNQTHL